MIRFRRPSGCASQAISYPATPPVGYTCGAVELIALNTGVSASLTTATNLGAADSSLLLCSDWVFIVDLGFSNSNQLDFPIMDNFNSAVGIWSGAGNQTTEVFVSDAGGSFDPGFDKASQQGTIPYGAWFNRLVALDMNHAAGARIAQVYINDVAIPLDAGAPFVPIDAGAAFQMAFSASIWKIAGSNVHGSQFYLAESYCAAGQILDLSVTANRRKFISATGKPVDLGADGSTPTGVKPTYFLHQPHGDSDPATFLLNAAGTGAFTNNGDPLTIAPSSPSG